MEAKDVYLSERWEQGKGRRQKEKEREGEEEEERRGKGEERDHLGTTCSMCESLAGVGQILPIETTAVQIS